MKLILLSTLAVTALFAQQHTQLKVGDEAPDFTLPNIDNKPIKLSDYKGKKAVVLAFFPAAFTSG